MLSHNGREAFRASEVAESCNLSLRTIRKLIAEGTIRSVKIGTAVRIPAEEVDRLLGRSPAPQHNPTAVPA